jgi:hypothetical protein
MTEIDGIIRWLGQLPTASTKERVRLLKLIAVNAEHIVNQVGEELEFEHALEVFNQHGAEAGPPFGAMLINGRVLVCNYRTAVGVWVNGHVKDKSFITREVEVRRDWPKGEKGYE